MSEAYFILKRKLEELGYNNYLPVEAVQLVECLLADLLQTTRSLQHYMDLSKEALNQRDTLMLEVEPYKCDNTKLIKENNRLHQELMHLKEDLQKSNSENKRSIKSLTEELMKKEMIISKLQHEVRELSLRSLCTDTVSSRIKSKKKDLDNAHKSYCTSHIPNTINVDNNVLELTKTVESLEEKIDELSDEILLLKHQLELRNDEIIRLNMLLEGGRPLAVSKDCCNVTPDDKNIFLKQIKELESLNEELKKQIQVCLAKQHEAMLRALDLADRNKLLQQELQKVDALALKVEEDCNIRISEMNSDMKKMHMKLDSLSSKNIQLEKESSQKQPNLEIQSIQECLNLTMKEKEALHKQVKDLLDLNKNLQDKIISLSDVSKNYFQNKSKYQDVDSGQNTSKYATKEELQTLLESERQMYEKHLILFQDKLNDAINIFDSHISKCKEKNLEKPYESGFVKELHNKLCESEQKILLLKKENNELCKNISVFHNGKRQNYEEIVRQLNIENSELSKENISLCKQLREYKNLVSEEHRDKIKHVKIDLQKIYNELETVKQENNILRRDKQEYLTRYKETVDLVEMLKRDLALKQRQVEQLEEENCTYRVTNRSDKASADHMKEKCSFLQEQMKKIHNDVIKEQTLSNQMKNIHLETERSCNEMQNALQISQKQLAIAKDNIESLEKRCKDLQSDIVSLKNDKTNLLESMKRIDHERDKVVIELDHKTEALCAMEQKCNAQSYDIEKLEAEIMDLKRKLNFNKVSEHKLSDSESQIKFLNGEIKRLTLQLDNAIIENKQLQDSLADANGALKINRIEYEKSRKEVDGLKQQLQQYVAEVRRIEDLLSQKEAERSDLLEHFASLSVEANILESTNHSLESESASKSVQLQSYINKIQDLESRLSEKENIIDSQSARHCAMTNKISNLESEIKLLTEEKHILEQNVTYLKQMCNNLQSERHPVVNDSELKLYENKIKSLSEMKVKLELDKSELKNSLSTTEKLLDNARKEIIELKLALQDATTETVKMQEKINKMSKSDIERIETSLVEDLDRLMFQETVHESSHEDDEEIAQYSRYRKKLSKFTHGSTV